MATFVLVHGAWHGSWCWKRVRARLRAQGHEVFTPTLTGIGERSHLLDRAIDLETHIRDVEQLIRWEELTDVILCGHSYGGMVISGAADRLPERLRALVYIDAFVPEDGKAVFDYLLPERAATFRQQAAAQGDGWRLPPLPGAAFNLNAADLAWVDRQCTAQPLATFTQPLRLSRPVDELARVALILAGGYRTSSFRQFAATAEARGWPTAILPGGHDLMLDCPEDLTRALVAAI